jgi:hypothetical protein
MNRQSVDSELLDIPGFIRGCIERAGGAVEAGPAARIDALLPPELEAVAGGRTWMRLALAADGLGGGAEPAMPGSPFLDSLIGFAAGRGTVAVGYLPAGRLKRKGLREEVERTLLFSNCRTRYEQNDADVLLSATAQFDFKVMFFSEERRERLYSVLVNLSSNLAQPLLAERLAGLRIETEPVESIPEAAQVPATSAYETACRALRQIVADEAARQQARITQRFAVEFARISEYYSQVIATLERRRVRESPRSVDGGRGGESRDGAGSHIATAADEERRPAARPLPDDSLSHKVESARRERERKLRELGETYGMRIRTRLSSARCLWQPKAFFKVQIDRGSSTRTLTLAYDGLLERIEPPACDSCGRETTRLWASPNARLLCPACTGP